MTVLESKVEKGMKWLDEGGYPIDDWTSRINTRMLNLARDDDCVLGQLFGSYIAMQKVCGWRKLVKLGFQLTYRHGKYKNWNKLTSIWANKIEERRLCKDVNGVVTV